MVQVAQTNAPCSFSVIEPSFSTFLVSRLIPVQHKPNGAPIKTATAQDARARIIYSIGAGGTPEMVRSNGGILMRLPRIMGIRFLAHPSFPR